jgi:hypothetical protein
MGNLTKMDMYEIKQMKEAGMSDIEISYVFEISERQVFRVLSGESGKKQDEIADRMEAFLGGSVANSGNYLNGELIPEFIDPTAEEADWLKFLEKLAEEENQ